LGKWVAGVTVVWFLAAILLWLREPGTRQLERELHQSKETVDQLRSALEASKIGYQGMFRQQLRSMSKDYRFGHTERISFYIHDGKAFVLQGRYSANPHFDKPGRLIYPDNQGCIGKAYAVGDFFITDLPNFETDKRAYLDRLKNDYGIDKKTATSFKMQSRSLSGHSIENQGGHKVAVVIFESLRIDVLDHDKLTEVMRTAGGDLLALLETTPIQPQPSLATREGF
jgi:hypothetical protein